MKGYTFDRLVIPAPYPLTNYLHVRRLHQRIFAPRMLAWHATNRIYQRAGFPRLSGRFRYFRDSQKEEYFVVRGFRPHSVHHTLDEKTSRSANLPKEEAQARAETFLRHGKGKLRIGDLVDAQTDKKTARTDHSLVRSENPPKMQHQSC